MDAPFEPIEGYERASFDGASFDGASFDGASFEGEDEVLDGGPRRRVPRWLTRLALTGAVVAGLVVAHGHGSGRQLASPPSPAPVPIVVRPVPAAASSVHALLISPRLRRVYTVIADRLAVNDLGSDERFAISSTSLSGAVDSRRLRLVDSPVDDILWVVPLGRRGSHLLEGFDPRTLRRVARIRLIYPMDNPSVLDGRLYLNYGPELFRVSHDHRRLELAARLNGSGGPMAVDPARHRLLYLDYYNPLRVRSWSPRTGEGVVATLPVTRGQLTVVRGRIWAAGYGTGGGATLLALDPRTLRPRSSMPLRRQLGAGAVIVGTGDEAFYVRAGPDRRSLWCVDSRTGAVGRSWPDEPGAVASTRGTVMVASPTHGVRPLPAAGCAG